MRCECVYLFYCSLLLFILSALIQKQQQRVVLDGSKIIRIVLLWKRATDTVDISTRFKQGERVFLLSVSRCSISRLQAHVRGVTRWEAVILNYQCSIRREFLVWQNRRHSSLAALMWQLWTETITKHIQNWTRGFVKLIVENHCLPNTSYGALRKPCGRSTSVFCSVESGVTALDFGMSDIWFVIAVL